MNNLTRNIAITIISIFALGISIFILYGDIRHYRTNKIAKPSYIQPNLTGGIYPWSIRSIDTQIVSKHWPEVSGESVKEQVTLMKNLGANYVAIGTPYDRPKDLALWANEIHSQDMNVWFRSHWASWEGDEGMPATMSPDEYLTKTREFILANKELFAEGDAFTVAVEAEQVQIGLGKRFLTWDEYRDFLIDEINVAGGAFTDIGLEGKVHTNWLSVNGWIVQNIFNQELADSIGLITVDHYVGQNKTIGELEDIDNIIDQTEKDLDDFYKKWKVPILLGEWGYHIYQPVSEERQAIVVDKLFERLKTKPYLVGINYWAHMGNTAALISDNQGRSLQYKKAADIVKLYFDPLSLTPATESARLMTPSTDY